MEDGEGKVSTAKREGGFVDTDLLTQRIARSFPLFRIYMLV